MSKTIEEKFNHFTKLAKILPKTTNNNDLLCLYGFYKQATIGDCNTAKPASLLFSLTDQKQVFKWDAWNKNKGMKKEEAMKNYINAISIMINK